MTLLAFRIWLGHAPLVLHGISEGVDKPRTVGGGFFLWALIRLARGRPSAGIGASLVIIATGSLGYALYAAAGEHLLPSERVHHIVWPAVVGAIMVALGIVHVVRALRKKELAFLE